MQLAQQMHVSESSSTRLNKTLVFASIQDNCGSQTPQSRPKKQKHFAKWYLQGVHAG